jgi:hypothetical protein
LKYSPRAVRFACGASLVLALSCEGTSGTLVVQADQDGQAELDGGHVGTAGSPGVGRSPLPGVTWQAQLSGSVDTSLNVDLFYLDADFTSSAAVSELRAKGKIVLCYSSAGTYEPWRDDANDFPESVLGEPLADYPREQWLDVRAPEVRALMHARFAALKRAGCDGVYPSTLEAHLHASGFPITRDDMIAYANWLATEIHLAGMSAGLSAPADLVPDVEARYDWALTIDCLTSSGCAAWVPVRQSGRAVLLVEYGDASDAPRICGAAGPLGFDALVKRPAFDGVRVPCPAE